MREYLYSGTVPHYPTLIVCGFTMIAAIQSLFSGLILENNNQKDRRDFEIELIKIEDRYRSHAENDKSI